MKRWYICGEWYIPWSCPKCMVNYVNNEKDENLHCPVCNLIFKWDEVVCPIDVEEIEDG